MLCNSATVILIALYLSSIEELPSNSVLASGNNALPHDFIRRVLWQVYLEEARVRQG